MAKEVFTELTEDKLQEAYQKLQDDSNKTSVQIADTGYRLERITDPIQKIKPAKGEHRRFMKDYAVVKIGN